MNEPKLKELEKKNEGEKARVARENAEYEALVTAGLRHPREPRKPWISDTPCEPYVVVKNELLADLEKLVEILQGGE